MDKDTFMNGLRELESFGRGEFAAAEMRKIEKDILLGYHPTVSEWNTVVDELGKECNWLPRISEIHKKMQSVRKRRKGSMAVGKVPCTFQRCGGEGFLMVERDGVRTAVGCGCDNTPRWVIEEKNTLKNAIDRGTATLEEATTLHRKPVLDLAGKHKPERWEKIIKLYKEDKWVPKFMRERFDVGNFNYPTEWPGGESDTRDQLKDCPFKGAKS